MVIRRYPIKPIVIAVMLALTISCSKKNPAAPAKISYSLSDLVGNWVGSGYTLTVTSDGKVSGGSISATWKIDSEGKITGTGSYSYISGSHLIEAGAEWSLQMSSDKNTISGILDVTIAELHNMPVTLTKKTKPTNLTILSISENGVILQWSDNSNNEKGFSIERKNSAADSYIVVGTTDPNVTIFNNVFILKADTSYYYRVRTFENIGDYSNEIIATLTFTPTNLTIVSISDHEIKLNWNDNSSFEKGFKIERTIGSNSFTEIASVDSSDTYFNDNMLDKTQIYRYRIRAYTDNNYSKYSDILKIAYQSGSEICTLSGYSSGVNSVSFSPNGQLLASANEEKIIKLWRVSDGTLLHTLSGHVYEVSSVAFSPDGQILASGSSDVRLWEVSMGSLLRTLKDNFVAGTVVFSPDGQTIACGCRVYGRIFLWRVSDGKLILTLSGHTDGVHSLSFSPDGKILASGSYDKTIKLWQMSDGALIRTLIENENSVNSVQFSLDGSTLVGAFSEGTVKIWQSNDGSLIRTLNGHNKGNIYYTFLSPDAQSVACSNMDGTIKLWRLYDDSLICTLVGHAKPIWSISFFQDGQMLASGSGDATVKIWSLQSSSWRTIQ